MPAFAGMTIGGSFGAGTGINSAKAGRRTTIAKRPAEYDVMST